jgi:hypothetical protein
MRARPAGLSHRRKTLRAASLLGSPHIEAMRGRGRDDAAKGLVMKWSAIRNWALTVTAAAGLVGTAGALAERMLERARDDPRRQVPAEPEHGAQPAAELARVAHATQPATPSAAAVTADDARQAAAVRRYIPLVVPGLAILLLVCIVAIWHMAL